MVTFILFGNFFINFYYQTVIESVSLSIYKNNFGEDSFIMKNIKKKALIVLCVALALCALLAVTVFADVYDDNVAVNGKIMSGENETNLTWQYTPTDGYKGILTISGTDTTIPANWGANNNSSGTNTGIFGSGFQSIYWRVEEVKIEAPITSIGVYGLSWFTICEKITLPATLERLGSWGVFYRNDKLKTVVIDGTEGTDGVIDLRNITAYDGNATFYGAFKSSAPTIYFADDFTITGKDSFGYFGTSDCTKITAYCKEGSAAETILNKSVETMTAANRAQEIEIRYYAEEPDAPDGGILFDGFQARVADYNGLRGIFRFDGASVDANEAKGYTLKEYGTLIAAEKNVTGALTLESSETNPKIVKQVVWNGDYVGKLLKDPDGNSADFAVAVVRYPTGEGVDVSTSYIKDDVRMAGYSVWEHTNGTTYTCYSYYKDDSAYGTSLYDVLISQYKLGIINAGNTEDVAVYDVLKMFAPEGYADAETTTGTEEAIANFTYSLIPNIENNFYTAIIRANNEAGTVSAPNETLYGGYTVDHIVFDYGVKTISQGVFVKEASAANNWTEIRTVVYNETLEKLNKKAFTCANGSVYVRTVFKAGTEKPTDFLWDLSGIASVDLSGTVQKMQVASRVCLPTSTNTLTDIPAWAFSNLDKCAGVYVDGENYIENTINFGGASFTKIDKGALSYFENESINAIILPLTITDVADNAFAGNKMTITVKTAEKVDALANAISASGVSVNYTNLDGTVNYLAD